MPPSIRIVRGSLTGRKTLVYGNDEGPEPVPAPRHIVATDSEPAGGNPELPDPAHVRAAERPHVVELSDRVAEHVDAQQAARAGNPVPPRLRGRGLVEEREH